MYKITELLSSRPNDNYTGLIHMVRYVDLNNPKDYGIMFISQSLDNKLEKSSFFAQKKNEFVLLDKKTIEKEFGVKLDFNVTSGGVVSKIYARLEGEKSFLYDDSFLTSAKKRKGAASDRCTFLFVFCNVVGTYSSCCRSISR